MRGRTRAFPIFLILLAGLFIAASRPGNPTLYPAPAGAKTVDIYLVDNGYHADIALPRKAVMARGGPLAMAASKLEATDWVLLGWGDAGFYTETGTSVARAMDGLRALFKPGNPSVVHLSGVSRRPDQAFADGVRRITLSEEGFRRLLYRANAAFALEDGRPVGPVLQRSADEGFFGGVESFSLLRLCNHWSASLLNEAGVPVNLMAATVPFGLTADLWLRAQIR